MTLFYGPGDRRYASPEMMAYSEIIPGVEGNCFSVALMKKRVNNLHANCVGAVIYVCM